MDWLQDNACLNHNTVDLDNFFKYGSQPSTVVKIFESGSYRMQIWSLETDDQWAKWLDFNTNNKDTSRGFILILAKRAGEGWTYKPSNSPITYSDWLAQLDMNSRPKASTRRATTFASLGEKPQIPHQTQVGNHSIPRNQQSIRTLPFSKATFQTICEKFRIHESIIRAMSRSDVPSVCCNSVEMGQPAYVYNCRTPNLWPSDLALSATYFPRSGFTFAVIFGCSQSVESSILGRLHTVTYEAAHPLLLPGMFLEFELIRHKGVVETSINNVETKIFELDFQSDVVQYLGKDEIERRNEAKRTAWLDLTYLRNSLISWNTQILKISEHANELNAKLFADRTAPKLETEGPEADDYHGRTLHVKARAAIPSSLILDSCMHEVRYVKRTDSEQTFQDNPTQLKDESLYWQRMRSVGSKVKVRLEDIRAEYDELIRDCTMRVDGMAMATQWAHSETAVEIALATSRDSNVMRSISLVTMIFLPGTFFASVFSMTFFDWSANNGQNRISSSLWIYVVITVLCTTITVGLWYFFVIHRRTKRSVDKAKLIVD